MPVIPNRILNTSGQNTGDSTIFVTLEGDVTAKGMATKKMKRDRISETKPVMK
jgi:hypothetical protein